MSSKLLLFAQKINNIKFIDSITTLVQKRFLTSATAQAQQCVFYCGGYECFRSCTCSGTLCYLVQGRRVSAYGGSHCVGFPCGIDPVNLCNPNDTQTTIVSHCPTF